jgi:hypothetical protein
VVFGWVRFVFGEVSVEDVVSAGEDQVGGDEFTTPEVVIVHREYLNEASVAVERSQHGLLVDLYQEVVKEDVLVLVLLVLLHKIFYFIALNQTAGPIGNQSDINTINYYTCASSLLVNYCIMFEAVISDAELEACLWEFKVRKPQRLC